MTYPETPDNAWTVAEAKAKFSEVIERARTRTPQMISRHGRPAVVVVSAEEWARKTGRRGTLADFLSLSPLKGVELDLRRPKEKRRPLAL
ncbi:MAG TPA: type II toxin-antitoxin system Phd/YefM family antitoxin [Opitutaceae bacterium]|nr:type II toxin-antitoxin system Phd/YefM family antitoxin [Opitutaceae bacterium]